MPQTNTKFRNHRLGRSWTLPELAARCVAAGAPTDDGNLSRIERGLQVPRPKLRGVLADLLDLELTDFDDAAADDASAEAAATSERATA